MKYDIIIIGAGASGVMTLNKLSNAGYTCCMLEAGSKAGGRIDSIHAEGFTQVVESGAEFIHGNLPLTLSLLKEAGIPVHPVGGRMISIENGRVKKNREDHMDLFLDKAATLITDMSLRNFLDQYFTGNEFSALRENITRFAGGFDLADAANVSVLSLKKEWLHEDETQYRIAGGYGRLIDYLLKKSDPRLISLHYRSIVTRTRIDEDGVIINTADGREFQGKIAVVTVSMGVLKAQAIQFDPLPAEYIQAIQQSGFGPVIKFLLEFKSAFWEKQYPDTGFFITNEEVPTWWTQASQQSNLLTGWLGGPLAEKKSILPENDLLKEALNSLSAVFNMDNQFLKQQLVQYKIINWKENEYVKGGYSYATIDSAKMKKVLSAPVSGRIYFAGEAIWNGESQGTVEAALQSGLETAEKILSSPI